MALCAVNLAECAEEKIPPSMLVEIHLTAAMGLKTRYGGKLGFLAVSTLHFLLQNSAEHFPQPVAKKQYGPTLWYLPSEGVGTH